MENREETKRADGFKEKFRVIEQLLKEIQNELNSLGLEVSYRLIIDRFNEPPLLNSAVRTEVGRELYRFSKQLYEKGILKEKPCVPLVMSEAEAAAEWGAENGSEVPQ